MGIEQKFSKMSNEEVAKLGQNNGCLKEAVDVLCIRVKPLLMGSIFKIVGDHESAEDVYQNVSIKIFQSLHSYNSSQSFSTWVYRVAYNCAIDYIRKRKPEIYYDSCDEHGIEEVFGVEDPNPNPEEFMVHKEQISKLIEAVQSLPDKYRETSTLLYFNGLKIEQVSEILGIVKGTVRWRSLRARKLLKKELSI